MIRIYRADDVGFKGYDRGKRVIEFSKDLSKRPPEFKEKSAVELLTENDREMYSLKRILFDKHSGIFYPDSFAVNYGAIRVDSWPLVRGFIPEGERSRKQTLCEIMPNKKEIHIIPEPNGYLFYEEIKISPRDIFYFEGTPGDFIAEFRLAGFSMKNFPPKSNGWTNPKDIGRYFKEDGFEDIEDGLFV
jgi:hypothetical protein